MFGLNVSTFELPFKPTQACDKTASRLWEHIGYLADTFEANMDIARIAAAQLFYKWGGFEAIPVEGSISYQDLAVATKSEEALLS